MDAIRIIGLVLAAFLIGAAIPTLLQLRSAIVEMRRLARQSADRITEISKAACELAETGRQLKETVRVASAVGAAVGPALGAAVRVLRGGDSNNGFHDQRRKEESP